MIVIQQFTDQSLALQSITLLRNSGIEANLSQKVESGVHVYLLEVAAVDKEEAMEALGTPIDEDQTVDLDMTDYTLEELSEIIVQAETYAAATVAMAKEELANRGASSDIEALENEHEKHVENLVATLSKGKPASSLSIILGYTLALLGGLIGFAMGWFIETGKTTAPTGEIFYTYDADSRRHGNRIKWIGIVAICISVVLRFLTVSG